jgi:hypothetical protein
MTAEVWLPPSTKNPRIVGRFADHVDHSRDVPRKILLLLTRPINATGDSEVSTRPITKGPESDALKLEFSAAWQEYLSRTQTDDGQTIAAVPDTVTPLEALELDRTSEILLRQNGVTLVDQLARLPDDHLPSLPLRAWRERARDLLRIKAARPLATQDEEVAALRKQLDAAMATIAEQKARIDAFEAAADVPLGWGQR